MFGEDAELYDRARPGYSDEVIDLVCERVAPAAGGRQPRAVEVGAGTGKATAAVAGRGLAIEALEPDPAMAAVLARKVAPHPAVRVSLVGFEEWDWRPGGFDLLYSAQAWHWIRPEVRYLKAAAVLRPGGGLALLWHRARWAHDDPLRAELDALYRREAPDLHEKEPGFPGIGSLQPAYDDVAAEVGASGAFADVTVDRVPWRSTFDVQAYTDLMQTQSDHRLLDPDRLGALVAQVAELVARHGGTVTVPYETVVVRARRLTS